MIPLLPLLLLLLLIIIIIPNNAVPPTTTTTSRHIRIKNNSKSLLTIYWVNPYDGKYVQQYDQDLFPGAANNINSYVGHEFAVIEVRLGCLLPDGRRGGGKISESRDKKFRRGHGGGGEVAPICNESRFVVTDGDDQIIEVTGEGEGFKANLVDDEYRSERVIGDVVSGCFGLDYEGEGDDGEDCGNDDGSKVCTTEGKVGGGGR